MDLVTKPVVTGAEAEACWSFYDRAFEELRIKAAQRHAMTRDEFDDVMVDGRVDKILAAKPGSDGPCGMATLTNDLKAVPLISPEYYAHRWPQFYAEQKIYYVGFLAIDPNYHGTGVLSKLLSSMCAIVPPEGGILAADICSFNEDSLKLPELFARVCGTFRPKPTLTRHDA